jgi:homoserine dehydrogenase
LENKVIRAALLGMGTVGTGVYKVLKRQQNEMEQKLGCSVKIDRILVRNTEKARAKTGEDPVEITDRFEDIITDPGL